MGRSTSGQPDEIGFGGLQLIQGQGFRFGIDAILLAAFTAGETGGIGIRNTLRRADANRRGAQFAPNICDMGCGSGIVSLVLSHKIPNSSITGVEIQAEEAARATENVARNHLTHRIRIISSDILNIRNAIEHTSLEISPDEPYRFLFDVVVTNPPYFRRGGAIPNAATGKYIARHETTATTEDFVRVASTLLPDGGDFFMVHRPDRLVDICAAMRHHHLEPKELQMVTPHPGEPANILLIHGIKGAGPELRMLPNISVRDKVGEYTPLIHRMYEREEAGFKQEEMPSRT